MDNKDKNKVKPKWLDIAGTAPDPLMGEDAQEWVTRTRREAQEHRDRLLEKKSTVCIINDSGCRIS